jgi:hypothetical protein
MKFIVDDFVHRIYIRSCYRQTNRRKEFPKNSKRSAPYNNTIIKTSQRDYKSDPPVHTALTNLKKIKYAT